MSDMRMPQGAPPQGGAPSKMEQARSPLNPTDMAYAASRGTVRPDMPVGEFFESQFGIKWDDPLQVASQKMAQKAKTASPVGKMQAMAGGSPGAQPGPQGGVPPMDPAQQKPRGGLDALMG